MVLAVPLLLLCLIECGLRIAGIGHPTSFLVRKQVRRQTMLVDNPWFGLRFFPPALARSPSPVCIPAKKPPGTFRIFLFGESAALGDPRPAYGVGRYLETLLTQRFPGMQFQVVCVAMTAINSHAILPIARECASYQGDLWIVYMGNNEFAGPFGANTVFGPQAPPVWAVRAFLSLQNTRLGQLLVSLSREVRPSRTTPAHWAGLKMFLDHQLPPQDARREQVYKNFERNLNDLLVTAKRSSIPIVLSSVASSLKDCGPFGSYPSPEDKIESNTEWRGTRDHAEKELHDGNFSAAIDGYRKAVELSPTSAEPWFRLGRCLLSGTNRESARQSFLKARDLDTLPFRADSRINTIIAAAGLHHAGEGVTYIDGEQALAAASPNLIPGSELFYEHVHLNWTGNYQLALALAQPIATNLPGEVTRQQKATWAQPADCAESLGLSDWNRYAIFEEILRRISEPPFTGQLDHGSHLSQLTNAMLAIRQRMGPESARAARAMFETIIERRPTDHWLHHNYAELLTKLGDLPGATAQMRVVCQLLPENHAGYLQLGKLLARQKQYDEARGCLETALKLRPDVFDVRVELGQVLAGLGKLEEALDQYAQAERSHGDGEARLYLLQADVLARQHKRTESISRLRQAIQLQPNYVEAHELLGIELATGADYPAAQAEFEELVRLRPEYAEGHLNLGIALARQRRFPEALEKFETALRLDPQNAQAREFLSTIRQLQAQSLSP